MLSGVHSLHAAQNSAQIGQCDRIGAVQQRRDAVRSRCTVDVRAQVLWLHHRDVVDPLPPDQIDGLILPLSFHDKCQTMGPQKCLDRTSPTRISHLHQTGHGFIGDPSLLKEGGGRGHIAIGDPFPLVDCLQLRLGRLRRGLRFLLVLTGQGAFVA